MGRVCVECFWTAMATQASVPLTSHAFGVEGIEV